MWNPWHGCHKLSAGCVNCYVYRIDKRNGRDSSVVEKNINFDAPIKRKRNGEYKMQSGDVVATCFSSDFFVEEADQWRAEAWSMIKERCDLHFFMITKRIDRFHIELPADWGEGYDNVTICSTIENQDRADYRMPIFIEAPIKHKMIACEPLLEKIDLSPYLGPWIKQVVVGGESGKEARICNYDWILDIRSQCAEKNIPFQFRQTGSKFMKDGVLYNMKRQFQYSQARKAGIDYKPLPVFYSKKYSNAKQLAIHYPTRKLINVSSI